MKTVNEVSKISGVSVRTLQYYDEIGLLKPGKVTDAGYRLYGEEQLMRLQTILLFKELEFPLKDIKAMLDSPCFDRTSALKDQLRLLKLKKEHTEKIISLTEKMIKKGDTLMEFNAFDKTELEARAKEARERWGGTKEYEESEKRAAKRSAKEETQLADGLMDIFAGFGSIRSAAPCSPDAQELVKKLKDYISANYYPCTDNILLSLGEMYVNDERFKKNIDSRGGDGTAEYVNAAIKAFCKK